MWTTTVVVGPLHIPTISRSLPNSEPRVGTQRRYTKRACFASQPPCTRCLLWRPRGRVFFFFFFFNHVLNAESLPTPIPALVFISLHSPRALYTIMFVCFIIDATPIPPPAHLHSSPLVKLASEAPVELIAHEAQEIRPEAKPHVVEGVRQRHAGEHHACVADEVGNVHVHVRMTLEEAGRRTRRPASLSRWHRTCRLFGPRSWSRVDAIIDNTSIHLP